MSAATAAKAKKPHLQLVEDSVEKKHASAPHLTSINGSLGSVQSDVLSVLWNDLLGGGSKSAGEQLFGTTDSSAARAAEMYPGKIIDLAQKRQEKQIVNSENHMEYFRKIKNADVLPKRQEDAVISQKVEQIRMEIKQLMKTSKILETTFKQVQIEQKVVHAGKYHETLFDFVLSLLKSARSRMEEGASWMNVTRGKKQQKQYWSMFKKHGTTFGLSNERTVATQTG